MAEPTDDMSDFEAFKKEAAKKLTQSFDIRKITERFKKEAEARAKQAEEEAKNSTYKETPVQQGGPGTQSIEEQYPAPDFSNVGRSRLSGEDTPDTSLASRGLRDIEYEPFTPGLNFLGNIDTIKAKLKFQAMKTQTAESPTLFRKARQ